MLQVTLPADYEAGVQFYCTVHSTMNGYFNLSILTYAGNLYDAYWGDIEVTVSGDFGSMDVKSFNTGVLGGTGLLVYNNGFFLPDNYNPITIFIDGNKTVAATFLQDTTDADSDGLTAYQEHVLYGTNPDLADTDGDTHSDFVELVTFGSDPLDAASVPTYQVTVSAFNGTVSGAGAIEINTNTTLTATPASGFVFAGWYGDAAGPVNPLTLILDSDKTVGAEFISTGTYNRIEQLALSQGEAAVVAAPGDYGLHTPAELQANYTTGLTDGLAQGTAAVIADPSSYDLFNAEMIQTGLGLGGMRISDTTGSKLISFNIESSEDLQTWTLEERVERILALPPSGSLFIRVSVPDEDVVPMVLIPAGTFEMGDNFGEGQGTELPVHTVMLSAYRMGETEVTWAQWQEVRDWAVANGYTDLTGIGAGKGDDHPVHSVSWYDVVKWCNAASEKIGLEPVYYLSDGGVVYRTGEVTPFIDYTKNGYRLPTEAEWERAARGGLEGKRFPWGDTISHADANYEAIGYGYDLVGYTTGYHPDHDEGGTPYTSPVKSFAANGLGLYDMAGNLFEWCGDWSKRVYSGSSPITDPVGPESGSNRMIRGGVWSISAGYCRVAYRDHARRPSYSDQYIGFRVCRSTALN
jgi:formylglycine-generating enzyme required for sulfatase activity